MSHHIYQTEGLILGTYPSKEADRQLLIYTREFGLLRATAQGVREIKSKLRYSVQPYSHTMVNLVRGRIGWRLTNARLEENFYQSLADDKARLLILARVFSLLRRMVHGEEKNVALFESLVTGFLFLKAAPRETIAEVEIVLVLRVLYHLGYVGDSPQLSTILVHGPWDRAMLSHAAAKRSLVLRSVNESLKASQL